MGYSLWGVRRSQTRLTDFHFTSLQTGDRLLCLSDGELGSVGPAFGGSVALGSHALSCPGGSPSTPTAIELSLVIHSALESSAFWCATFALLWSENQISRRVRAAGEVSGKKPRGGVWGSASQMNHREPGHLGVVYSTESRAPKSESPREAVEPAI